MNCAKSPIHERPAAFNARPRTRASRARAGCSESTEEAHRVGAYCSMIGSGSDRHIFSSTSTFFSTRPVVPAGSVGNYHQSGAFFLNLVREKPATITMLVVSCVHHALGERLSKRLGTISFADTPLAPPRPEARIEQNEIACFRRRRYIAVTGSHFFKPHRGQRAGHRLAGKAQEIPAAVRQ